MILKTRLEWTSSASAAGHRAAKASRRADAGARIIAFSKLSAHEGLSLGKPHFQGGDVSFYKLDDAIEDIVAKEIVSFEEAFLLFEAEKLEEGAECIAKGCFLPLRISYEVEYSADKAEALITPVLKIYSIRPATLCASLKVDGFELLPSARIPLVADVNVEKLRPVKLVRPKKYWSKTVREATLYTMELEIISGQVKTLDVRELAVWGS